MFRSHLLYDPTAFEEPLLNTAVSIIINGDKELVSVEQVGPGGIAGVEGELLRTCIAAAVSRREQVSGYL
jgi:exosome complex component RRP43